MFLLLNVKDLDIDSRKSVFFSLLMKYKYDLKSSTTCVFNKVQAYKINLLTKKVETHNNFNPSKNNYYIEVKK